jgi:hypothetical protein
LTGGRSLRFPDVDLDPRWWHDIHMTRWLALVLVLGVTSPASAQVFKPKAKKAEKVAKKTAPAPAEADPAPKQPRAAPTPKRVTAKATKKKTAADRTQTDAASEPAPKGAEKDYIKIWDDDEIE